jgi:hypothetical protein
VLIVVLLLWLTGNMGGRMMFHRTAAPRRAE